MENSQKNKITVTELDSETVAKALVTAALVVAGFTVIIRMCKIMVRDMRDMGL